MIAATDVRGRMTDASTRIPRVVWLSPSPPAERSVERVARIVGAQAVIAPRDLEVWGAEVPSDYSIATEIAGVERFARLTGWESFHMVGFSAGATVALAAALSLTTAVRTLALIEPASIGEDDWSATEVAFRARMTEVFSLAVDLHQDAFNRAVLHPDEPDPPPSTMPRALVDRGVVLHRQALVRCGFSSRDLGALVQPTLVVTGGRSHPRFAEVSDRLCAVLPNADAARFPERHHGSSPQRTEPERMAELLLQLWSRA